LTGAGAGVGLAISQRARTLGHRSRPLSPHLPRTATRGSTPWEPLAALAPLGERTRTAHSTPAPPAVRTPVPSDHAAPPARRERTPRPWRRTADREGCTLRHCVPRDVEAVLESPRPPHPLLPRLVRPFVRRRMARDPRERRDAVGIRREATAVGHAPRLPEPGASGTAAHRARNKRRASRGTSARTARGADRHASRDVLVDCVAACRRAVVPR
jgi:hypothetical protein